MLSFFTITDIEQFFMMACSIFAALIGYINRKKFYTLRLFYIYPLASFIQMSIFYAVAFSSFDSRVKLGISNSTINGFLLVEAIMIYHFFLSVIKSYTIKSILFAIEGAYLLLIFFFWFVKGWFFWISQHLYIYQAIIILIPCVIYISELFKITIYIKLSEYPHFWITIGTILYFGCTLPLFLLLNLIVDKNGIIQSYIYIINYICYSIFFLLIAKAYLCPQKTTTL